MSGERAIRELPAALERMDEIESRIAGRTLAVFLDYDGTLAPIVEDPREAVLSDPMRSAVEALREACPVAVVSGRDLMDVSTLVGIEGIHYAGSHGLDVLTPDGERHQRATEHLPALAAAARELEGVLETVPGAEVERKRFALAIHYRRVSNPGDAEAVEEEVDRVVRERPSLRKTGGKKIFEIRPEVAWDKGRAVLWILEVLGLEAEDEVAPFYVGDDVTDEDAFRALAGRGIGVVVRGESDQRATAAEYALAGPDEVREFLERLTALTEGRDAGGDDG